MVTASDNLDNTGTSTRTFKVQATSASLLKNLDRARSLGLITNKGGYTGLRQELLVAISAHNKGDHSTEWKVLGGFINDLAANSGNYVDAATASRFIAYAQDIITRRA